MISILFAFNQLIYKFSDNYAQYRKIQLLATSYTILCYSVLHADSGY